MGKLSELVDKVEQGPSPAVDVPVLLDPEASAKHRALEAELQKARSQPGGSLGDRGEGQIAQDIADLYESTEPTVFRFAPLSPQKWADLIAEHPPPKGERADVNVESFWPKAMAECCIDPEDATVEDFRRLRDSGKVSNGTWNLLISGCREANEGTLDVTPTSTASAVLRLSALRSPTAPREASPEASS